MNRLLRDIGLLAGLALAVACARLPKDVASGFRPSPGLSSIDSLMWRQPDSAFSQLFQFADTADVDSLDAFDRHYFQLLVAELLYKNDYAQSNRTELKQAVVYYDSLNISLADNSRSVFPHCGPDPQSPSLCDLIPFLSARTHYINGVGYYENDSAVEACAEYLKALEVMEDRFEEKELVGKKAQFMALAYTHLADCKRQNGWLRFVRWSIAIPMPMNSHDS